MPKDPHITGGIRHDWKAIKHEYVTNPDMSLRKVAEKYGVSHTTIYKKSKADNWFATRKKYQEEVVAKAIARTEKKMAKELSDEADFLTLMKGHVRRMLKDEDQFRRQFTTNMVTGESGETVTNKYDARALKDTMQTLRMIEEMSRSLYNIQKAEAIQRIQIENERLQIERERFEFEKEKAEFNKPDTGAVIRIEGFEEGWDE